MAEIIASAAPGRPILGAHRTRDLLGRALRAASATDFLGSGVTATCRREAALYATVLKLPPQEGAALMRAMQSQESAKRGP